MSDMNGAFNNLETITFTEKHDQYKIDMWKCLGFSNTIPDSSTTSEYICF